MFWSSHGSSPSDVWSFVAGLEPEAVIAGFQDMAVAGKSIDAPVMHDDGRID